MRKLYRGRLLLSSCLSGVALAWTPGALAQERDPNWQPRAEVNARAADGSSQVSIELFTPVAQNDANLLFITGRIGNDERYERNGSVTVGGRGKIGDDVAIGVNAGVDFYKSDLSKRDQTAVSFGLEGFTSVFDVRLNYRLPVTNRSTIGYLDPNASPVGALLVENNRLIERKRGWRLEDVPLGGVNAEIGATVPLGKLLSLRTSAAGFDYRDDAATKAYRGVRGGLELGVEDPLGSGGRFTLGAELQNDNRWGTQARGTLRLSIPLGGGSRDRSAGNAGLDRQMGDRIRRDYVTPSGSRYTDLTSNSFAIDARTGAEFGGIYYVNGAAAAAGAGSSTSPTTLADAVTRAGANGVVVAMGNAGNITSGGVTLATNQYLVGGASSVNVRHSNGAVTAFGFGSSNGTIVGSNAGGAAVTLGQGSVVRDVTVRGAGSGILANGVGGFALERVIIENTGGAGLTLTNTIGNVVVDGITIRGGGGAGVVVNGGSNVTLRSSVIGGGAGAIDINDAGGNLTTSLWNLSLSATGGTALDIDGSGAGTVTVAGLAGIYIAGGNGETGGFAARNVTFDSSSAAGIQALNAGTMQVGTTASRVNGAGVTLTEVDGALSFGSLNIANNAGTGLTVNNTKTGTFTLTSVSGAVDTNAGTALNLDPLLIDLTFASVRSAGAAGAGIILDNVQGAGTGGNALTIGTLTIANSGQQGLFITGGSTGLVTIGGGTITNSGSASVQIGEAGVAGSGGTIGLNFGVAITDSGAGPLASIFNTGGTIRFTGAITGAGPITIGDTLAGSSVIFQGATTITGSTSPAISLTNLAGSTVFSGPLSIVNPSGTAIVIGAVPGGVTFGDVDITGLGAATGLDLTGTAGNVTFSTLDITGTGAAGSTGIDLTNASNAGAVTIANPSIIQGVDIGANLTNAHITGSFRFGDGNAADGLESRITATTVIAVLGLNATQGTYDFADVQLDGNTNNITGGSFTTYYVLAGATGTGTATDPGSIAGAAASGAQYIVLLNDPNGGQDVIDTAGLTGGALSLTTGQSLVSFLNTDFFSVTGATVPANLIVSNLGPTGIVNTFAGSGAAILTSSLGTSTVNLANDTRIDGVVINNDAAGTGIFGSGVSNVIIRNSIISGNGGAITIIDGGAAASATLTNLNLSASGGRALALSGAGAGTLNVSGTGINITATGAASAVGLSSVTVGTLDIGAVTTQFPASNAVVFNQVAGGTVNVGSVTTFGTTSPLGSALAVVNSSATVNIGAVDITNTADIAVSILNNSGNVTLGSVYVTNTASLTAGVNISGNTGNVNLGAVSVHSGAGDGVRITGNGGTVALGQLTVGNVTRAGLVVSNATGSTTIAGASINATNNGIEVSGLSGNLSIGNTAITNSAGAGIQIGGVTGSASFTGTTTISGSNGIVLGAGSTGTISFGDTDITGLGANKTGLDARAASGTVTFATLDIAGSSTIGTRGINMAGATFAGSITVADSSTITGVGTGVDLTNAAITGSFRYGDGSNTDADGARSTINAITPITVGGINQTVGSYNFADVALIGDTTGLVTNPVRLFFVELGRTGAGTKTDPGSLTAALASNATVIVLLNNPAGGNDTLDVAGLGTFTLDANQRLIGFLNGDSQNVGGGTPTNMLLYGLTTGIVTNPYAGSGAGLLTNTGGGATVTLANGASIDGVRIGGAGIGVQGVGVSNVSITNSIISGGNGAILLRDNGAAASATLANLTLSATGGTVLNLLGTNGGSLNLRGSGISIAATGNARGLVMDSVTLGANLGFGAVSMQTAAGAGVTLNNVGGSGGLSFTSINVGGTSAGVGVSLGGNSAAINLGNLTVANTASHGVEIANNPGNVTLGTFNISNTGMVGLLAYSMPGTFTAAGGTVTNSGAMGIALADIDGSVTFTGGVTIANPGSTGITLARESSGTISFADVDITGLTAGKTGLDARIASGNITFGTLDITSTSATGTRGIDMTGAIFSGNLTIAGSSTITGVGTGVDLTNAAITGNFRYGDGSNTDANGAASTINATTPLVVAGLNSAVGTYNFADVNMVGDTSALATSAKVYWVLAGAGGSGTRGDPGSLAGAAASGADVIILINNPAGGADTLNANDATYGTGGTFTLMSGQQLRGFLYGDTITLPGGAPANVTLYNVATGSVTNPFAGSGAPTLTTTAGGGAHTVVLANNTLIDGVVIANGGTGAGVFGSGTSNVTIRNSNISGANRAIDLRDGGLAASVALSGLNLWSSNNSIALAAQATGGGSTTITQLTNILIEGGHGGLSGANFNGATFDADLATAGYQRVDATLQVGTGGTRLNGAGVVLSGAIGELRFVSLGVFNQGGTGLTVMGSALNLASMSGTIDTLNGHTLALAGARTDLVLDSIVHLGSGSGVQVTGLTGTGTGGRALQVGTITAGTTAGSGIAVSGNVNGTMSFGAGSSISGAMSPAISIASGTGTLDFTYNGSVTQSANAALLSVAGHNGTITFGAGSSLSATNGTGLQFSNADGTYAFNGTTSLNGGDAGIDILAGSSGSFTFANASITSPTGTAINIADSTASLSYTGSITQANNAALLSVLNHSGGTISFLGGTLGATNGSGLQFDNADGTYVFNGTTTLNGGDAGVDILNGSAGSFTFANASITSPTGTAINIADSTASLSYTGSVTQANNAALLSVLNHSGGTITFLGGTLGATNGTGLQFNNADGTYNFTGNTTLNGGDAGIDILADSTGSFTFGAGTTITNPSGTAITVDGSNANLIYRGAISHLAAATGAIAVINHAGGTLDFNTATLNLTGGNGLLFNNADGSYLFNNATLTGGAGIGISNGSAGNFTFGAGTSVTNAAVAAFSIANSTANVIYGGALSQASGMALGVSGHSGGTLAFTGAINVTGGTGLSFNDADGTYNLGAVALSGGARLALLGGSAGSFTFGDVDITGLLTNTTAVNLTGATGNITFATLDITGASAVGTRGIDMTGSTTAGNVVVAGSSTITGVGVGVDLTNAAITGNFRYGDGSNTDANGAASTINATTPLVVAGLNSAVGSYNFADVNMIGDTSTLATSAKVYWVLAGAGGSGTRGDPGSLAGAAASGADVIILINNPAGGADTLNANDAIYGTGGTFTLMSGQQLRGFLYGDTITLPGGAPANVTLYNIAAGIVTNPFAGSGAPTLTTTAGGGAHTVVVGNNTLIDGVVIANGGTGTGVFGSGVSNVAIRNSRISGANSAIDFRSGGLNASLALSNLNLWASNNSIALAAYAAGGGTTTITQLSDIVIEGGHGELGGAYFAGATFDADITTAGHQAVNASLQIGTAGTRVTGMGVELSGAIGALNFTNLGVFNQNANGLNLTGSALNLTSTAGTIDTVNGNTLALSGARTDLVLGSVVHAGTGSGTSVTNLTGIGAGGRALTIGTLSVASGSGIAFAGNNNGIVSFGAGSSIANTTGTAISIASGTGTLDFTYNGSVTQSANAALLSVAGHNGTITFGSGSNLSATNGIGLQFDNADGTYAFNGTTALNGGDAGIDILNGSAGSFTFANASITSPTGIAINIADSTASLSYTGSVTQANNAALLAILNHSGGTIAFQTGTLGATNGTGLQFDNADGTYAFNGTTTLNGGDAGIDILNGSAGSFTFANASITSPTGTAISIADSTASLTYTGSATQANNAALLSVLNHSGGTISFLGGTLGATNGNGLQFDNADGTYAFNGTTTLNGGDAGVDILNGSAGSFTLANASITSPTGAAINIADSTASLSYAGNVTQANNAALLSVLNHSGGTVRFLNGTLGATNGTGLRFSNADGTYLFNGTTTLNGGSASISILANSAGSFAFGSNTTITNPFGPAFAIFGSTASVIYHGTVNQSDATSLALSVSTHSTGTLDFSGATLNVTGGHGLTFNDADGTYNFGNMALSGGASLRIFGGSAGAFTFGNVDITGLLSNSTAVDLTGATGNVTFATLDIAAASAIGTRGIDLTGSTTASNVIVSGSSTMTGLGIGVDLTGAAITGNFRYGDGSNTDANGAASSIAGVTPLVITGLNGGVGNYNFADVNMVGDTTNLSVSAYFVLEGATGSGTRSDPGSLAGAEAANATYIVLLNNPTSGTDILDATLGAGGSFDLDGGQILYSFRDTDSFTVGGGAPANVLLYNVQTGVISNPFAGSGAPTLTASGANATLTLGGNNIIDGVVIANSGTGAGVLGNGVAGTNIIRNSTISGGAAGAIRIFDNAANVVLAMSNLTLASNGGNILSFDGTGAGTLTVSQLANLTVNHTTETGGFVFSDVAFDSDTVTAGLQAVNAGALTLGTTGARITGDGLSLTNVTGTLNFSNLNIANNGGTGLIVANSKLNNFTLGTTGGAIDTTNGTAINLDPLTINMVLNSVNASGGAYGILLDQVLGNFTVTGAVNVTGATDTAIAVRDNTALGVLFQGAVAINNTAGNGVRIVNNTGTTVDFTGGLGIVTTTGMGLVNGNGGALNVTGSGNTITTGSGRALSLSNMTVASGGISFDQITAATTAADAINASVVDLTGALNIRGLDLDVTGGGDAIEFNTLTGTGGINLTGTLDIDGGRAVFAGTLGTINVANDAGSSLTIDGALYGLDVLSVTSGTLNVASAGGSAAIGGSTNAAIRVVNGTGVTLNYGGTINAAQGAALSVQNSTGNVTLSGAIISTTTDTAFNFDNADGNYTISGNVSHTGGAGVAINAASAGGIIFSGASKTFNTGINAAITTAGTGTLSFTGGGLGITTTTGTGFAASGGGTVLVHGANNTITSGNATALSLNGVTLAPGGVTFQNISATPTAVSAVIANALTLNGALSIGGLTVSGGGTGATFSNLTGGAGVYLTGTIDIDGGTGFEFTGALETINIANGAGSTLTIDGASTAIRFNGVTSGNVNIGLSGASASIGATTSSTTAAIGVSGGTGGLLTYGGTIRATAGAALSVANSSSLVELSGTTTSTSANTLFDFVNADGTYFVTGAVSHNGGAGVAVDAASGGAITFSNASKAFNAGTSTAISMAGTGTLSLTGGGLDIDTTSGTGFSASGGTVVVTGANNRIDTTTGQILSLNGMTAGTGGINFASLTATGTVANNAILLSNLTGAAFNGGTVSIANGTSGAANDGIKVITGTAAITFGTTTIGLAGSNAIELLNSGSAVNFGMMNLAGANGSTVVIAGSTGPVTLGTGTIAATGAANYAVSVTGGTGDVSVGSALVGTNMVQIVDHETGTVTFGGDMASTVSGISVTNVNSGLIRFTGQTLALNATGAGVVLAGNSGGTIDFNLTAGGNGLDIVSSGSGFSAGSGGTVIVRGTGNSISTTGTGTALSLQNVTIGTSGFNFDNVSANGATTGILINGVGTVAPAIGLGTVNLQGITSRGIDITGIVPVGLAITDLDIGLNSNSAVALDFNGATLSAPIMFGDFDVTNAGGAGTSIAVDLRGTVGGANIMLGYVAGASSSISGVGTGIYLDAATNALFRYGDGESAIDTGSTISAGTAIDATAAPTVGTYDFRDVAFSGSPGAGFGLNRIYFVDSNGATGGGNGSGSDGSNPMTLAAAELLAGANDMIVLVNNGSAISAAGSNGNDSFVLGSNIQVRGFGNGVGGGAGSGSAPIVISLTVPSTILFSGGSSISIVDPTGNGAATLTSAAGANAITLGATGNRLSGFILDGGGAVSRGIKDNGAGATNTILNYLTVRNFGTMGIEITPSTSTTIDNVVFSGNPGGDILLNAANSVLSNITSNGGGITLNNATGTTTLTNVGLTGGAGLIFTNAAGVINATNVDITNPLVAALTISGGTASFNFDSTSSVTKSAAGAALSIGGGHSTGTFAYAGTLNITGGTGLQFDNADGTYNFTGTTTLAGGDAGIDILNGSGGTFSFGSSTSITSPMGTAFNVSGSTAAITYSGSITQANNAALLSILNHSGGTITFQTNTLSASNGTGLQFDNADGTYNFNGMTTLNGGDAGVDILNGSAGTFNFGVGTTITSPTGTAFNVSGSTAAITYNGNITQANNAALLSILNHSGGMVTFQSGTLSASSGTGLQFDNADSTYNFVGATTLNGGDAGVDILNGSGGTFSFGAGTTITSPTGAAFNVSGSTATVIYAGSITQANNAALLSILNHSAGTITFQTGTLGASNGTGLRFDNADGTYDFTGTTTLNGGDAGVDIVNGSDGTFGFGANTSITHAAAGDAFVLTDSNAGLTYSGNITDSNGYAVRIDNHDAGTVTFGTGTISSSGANALGLSVTNSNGGTINFNGQTTLSTQANAAVTLSANAGGTIAFNAAGTGLGITTTSGTAFSIAGGGTINVLGANNTIATGSGTLLDIANASAVTSTLNLNFADARNTLGANGILISRTAGTLTGSINITSGAIIATNRGVDIDGGALSLTYGGTIATSGTTARSVEITGISGGGATLSGNLTDNALGINVANNTSGGINFWGQTMSLNTVANATAVTLANNTGTSITFSAAAGGNGFDIVASGTGNGIDFTGGGTLTVFGAGSSIQTATGQILNLANGNAGAFGINFDSLTSTGSVAGNAININNLDGNALNGGNVSIAGTTGATADGIFVGGGSTTNLSFGNVTIANTGDEGIEINGAGNGTFTVGSVTINNTAGNGVEINGATNSVTLSSGAIGAINDPTGYGVYVLNGTGDVNIAASIAKTTAGNVVFVDNHETGTVTFSGNISATGGFDNGILVQNVNSGSVIFSGTAKTLTTGANTAVNLNTNTGGTIGFQSGGLAITTTSGTGFSFTGGGTLNVSGNGNTVQTGTGQILNLMNGNVGASGVTFNSLTSTGSVAGTAINISNLDGNTFSGGDVTIAGTTGATADGIFYGGGSTTNVNFGLVSISATGDEGIEINGAGNGTFSAANVAINNTGGNGLEINGATNSVTVSGGNIGGTNDPTGFGVYVLNGTGAISVAASVTKTTAGNVVFVDNHETGNVTFSGSISATGGLNNGIVVQNVNSGTISFTGNKTLTTGANTAVNLLNNTGGTISFLNGNMAINTTTGTGFTATGGGTVTVEGTGNTITSTTGTALNVVNTTIGTNGMRFQSISSNGGANGIVLNNTGTSGGINVTGTGAAGSGGTIQNSSGDGISLTSTENVRLAYMNVINNLGDGIGGSNINGFLIDNMLISGNGNDAGTDESGINISNLTGTASNGARPTGIFNSTIQNNNEFEVQITNSTGTLTNFQVVNSTFASNGLGINGNAVSPHGNLFNFLGTGTSQMGISVSGSVFTGNWNAASPPVTIVGSGLWVDSSGTSMTAQVSGSTFTNTNNGINVSTGPGSTTLTYSIDGNAFTGSRSTAINDFQNGNAPFTRTVNGRITNNIIGTNGIALSGSQLGNGISIGNEGAVNANYLISGNTIQQIGQTGVSGSSAIAVNVGLLGQATGGGTTNLTILNNTIRDILNSRGIAISNNQNTGTLPTIRLSLSGNSFLGTISGQAGNGQFIRLASLGGGAVMVTQGSASASALASEIDDANGFNDPTKVNTTASITYNQAAPTLPPATVPLP